MANNRPVYKTNFPLLGILGLIFITLKLTGHIAWSWWWVLAPFWVPLILALVIVGMLYIFTRK